MKRISENSRPPSTLRSGLGVITMPALKNPRHEAFARPLARGVGGRNAVLIKKPEKTIKRDEMGRFDRRADRIGQGLAGPGRPKGSLNKTTTQLKEALPTWEGVHQECRQIGLITTETTSLASVDGLIRKRRRTIDDQVVVKK
jgi:hypothetical protein